MVTIFIYSPFTMLTKLLRKALATTLALALFIPVSFAAAATQPVDIFPADTTMYLDVDLNQLPAFDTGTLIDTFSSALSSGSSNSDTSTQLFKDLLASKRFYIAMTSPSLSGGFSFLFPITDNQWATLLSLHPTAEKSNESGRDYYDDTDNAMTFAHVDSYLVLSEEKSVISALLKSYSKGDVFSKTSKYLNTVNKLTGGRLSTFFLDYYTIVQSQISSGLLEKGELTDDDFNFSKALDSFRQLGFGISQFNGGLQFQTVATKGTSPLVGAMTSFIPSLYTSAPAKHPAFYAEGYNLSKTFDAEMSLLGASAFGSDMSVEEELSAFSDELGFDIDKDFFSLLTKGYSVTVEANPSSSIPYVTLMADVKGNEATIQKTLDKIKGLTSALFSITTGVTGDGFMYISNDASVAKKIGTGADVSDFGDQLKGTITGFAFADFAQIAAIVKGGIFQKYNAMPSSEKTAFNFSVLMNEIDTIVAPWHRMTAISTMDSQSFSSTGKIFFDSSVYKSSYWLAVSAASDNISKVYARYERGKIKFRDVPVGAWYAKDVARLKMEGIIKGYGKSPSYMTFKPDQKVTRAEFLAMLYRGVYGDSSVNNFFGSMEFGDSSGDVAFKDIEISDWYFDTIIEAASKGLVKGYGDNTFRPNAFISRAEAVAMIDRFYQYNNDVEFFVDLPWRDDHSFNDVPDSIWYSDPIHQAYQLGVVDGASADKFEPMRDLNRAEAAKLISRLLRVKFAD